MEEQIELMIPIKVQIRLSGKVRRADNNYIIRWFDNTDKVVNTLDIAYFGYNMQQVLQEITALYQLNPRLILETKISMI
jgi:hypothetical protein